MAEPESTPPGPAAAAVGITFDDCRALWETEGKGESRETWMSMTTRFASTHAQTFSLKDLGETKYSFVFCLVMRIREEISSSSGERDYELLSAILDCLRICLREVDSTQPVISVVNLGDILTIVEAASCPVGETALRCLTNALLNNNAATNNFLSAEVNGLQRLLARLNNERAQETGAAGVSFFITRLLYMLASQQLQQLQMQNSSSSGGSQKQSPPPLSPSSLVAALDTVKAVVLCMSSQGMVSAAGEKRSDSQTFLLCEACKLLHFINVYGLCAKASEEENGAAVIAQLEALLFSFLNTSAASQKDGLVQFALQIFMTGPPQVGARLFEKGVVPFLCSLLEELLVEAAEFTGDRKVFFLSPILVVLNHVVTSAPEGKALVKQIVFPNPLPSTPVPPAPPSSSSASHEGEGPEGSEEAEREAREAARLAPQDAPPGTLRALLIALMTCLETRVKRLASELLFTICQGEDKDEFMKRTGFGNAIALLQMKGLV